MTQWAVEVRNLSKTFGGGRKALDDVSVAIAPGEMVALIGASGSGKSTLLRHLSGLVAGDRHAGVVRIGDHAVQSGGRLSKDVRRIRGDVGFVFQQFNLVNRLSVITNVLIGTLGRLPLWRTMLFRFPEEERRLAIAALRRVGIADWAFQRAATLSGGQQQRAAIARAMVQRANLVLADEPIASLDPEAARRVMESLAELNRSDGVTVLVSLHQVQFAMRYCPRTLAPTRASDCPCGTRKETSRRIWRPRSKLLRNPVTSRSATSRSAAAAAPNRTGAAGVFSTAARASIVGRLQRSHRRYRREARRSQQALDLCGTHRPQRRRLRGSAAARQRTRGRSARFDATLGGSGARSRRADGLA
jgi:phosphonate transport system ATP-binding protein